jgi:hypothetical protein
LRRLKLRGRRLHRILPRLLLGLASLAQLLLRPLRLISRSPELLLRLPELAPELLELALKSVYLPLDSFDSLDRSILCIGYGREGRGIDCNQRSTSAMAAVRCDTHAPPVPPGRNTHRKLIDRERHLRNQGVS